MLSPSPVPRRASPQPPVLIIGAHRSGTTATAEALELLGLQIGQRLDSHREPKSLQRVHESYLEKVGATWDRPTPFLQSLETSEGKRDCVDYLTDKVRTDFAGTFGYRKGMRGSWLLRRIRRGAPWGWKEPRTTLFARCWLEVYPEARILDVLRHPLSVALSIRQRELRFRNAGDKPTPQLDDLDYCLGLALTYVEEGDRLAATTSNYRRVRFEDLQANPRDTLETLAAFCHMQPARRQLEHAAATIRPEISRHWEGRLKEETKDLLARFPKIAQLGY